MKTILISIAIVAIPVVVSIVIRHLNPFSAWNIKKYKKCTNENISRRLRGVYWNQHICLDININMLFVKETVKSCFSKYKLTIIKREDLLFKHLQGFLLEGEIFQEAWMIKGIHGSVIVFLYPEDSKIEPLMYTNPSLDIRRHNNFWWEVEILSIELFGHVADIACDVVYGYY